MWRRTRLRRLEAITMLLSVALVLGACSSAPDDTQDQNPAANDQDGDGYPSEASGGTDCDDNDPATHPDATETCDNIDNDCDGTVDEGLRTTYYLDADLDGAGASSNTVTACAPPEGYVETAGDCDDDDPGVYPGAIEHCDSSDGTIAIDNDCDGSIDNDAVDAQTFYPDTDLDGFGDEDAAIQACSPPPGYVETAGDCDDSDPSTYDGAVEICDGSDNDCDGTSDEGWDFDGDGVPDCLATERCDGIDNTVDGVIDEGFDQDGDGYTPESCDCAPNAVPTCGLDCDDSHANAYPGAQETCDGIDNDCDGEVDEPDATGTSRFFLDADGDGYGDPDVEIEACSKPDGYSQSSLDCNDDDPAINPAAEEVCDGVDNDCDGNPEDQDALDASTWYPDADGDGYGDPTGAMTACNDPTTPEMSYVMVGSDCDDTQANTYPGADEYLDGTDNDCDGEIDEDLFSHGLTFDGTDDFVQVPPDVAPVIGDTITLEAWVRISAPTSQWHNAILNKWGDTTYGTAGVSLEYLTGPGTFAFFVSSDGVRMEQLLGNLNVETDTWYHVAAVADGTRLRLYVNGALDAQTAYSDTIHDNGLGILAGGLNPAWTSDHYSLEGDILEVRISDTARYTTTFSPPLPLESDGTTLLLLRFDECAGQVVNDSSPYGSAGFLGSGTDVDDQDPDWRCGSD